jgi:sugar lactone lactonase YvrE
MQAELAINAQAKIGEAPTWDAARQRLLWTDNKLGVIREVRANSTSGWSVARERLLQQPMAAAPAVTSCAFGGVNGDHLFVTCLGRRLPDVVLTLGISREVLERAATAPGAGGLFVCRPGHSGAPGTPFAN